MNMGKRIEQCLDELGWKQVQLLDKVPDLSPSALSALIKRDSKWSDFAEEIAEALGVEFRWLLTGKGNQWVNRKTVAHPVRQDDAPDTGFTPEEIEHVLLLRELDDDERRGIRDAAEKAKQHKEIREELAAIKRRIGSRQRE